MNELEQPAVIAVCRRCGRPLTAPLAVAAGVGSACALHEAADAPQGAAGGAGSLLVPEAALALLTARLGGLPDSVVRDIVDDAPGGDLAVQLAGLGAWMIQQTHGGEAWLERLALKWAREAGH